jgi:hypothetical protein
VYTVGGGRPWISIFTMSELSTAWALHKLASQTAPECMHVCMEVHSLYAKSIGPLPHPPPQTPAAPSEYTPDMRPHLVCDVGLLIVPQEGDG